MNLRTVQDRMLRGSMAGFTRILLAVPVYLVLTPLVLRALGSGRSAR